MIWIARIAAALVGLFSLGAGAMTILSPAEMGEGLGIGALSPLGLNALRADIAAFFLASAVAAGAALFGGRPHWILGAAVLYGLALLGRILGIVVDGVPDGIVQPLVVEFTMVVLSVFAAKALARG
ncbi:MAG: DUF4345 family protein [Parvibaculum sp.]|uniref:DUF4345 family protein n=1 Tax=Parvibaculum sp. TaxID=2024848 RepID=UPI001D40EC22|nr:DUF4345 family protein [Parvibaculum sp.]MBX3489048.1 DUF4345 family protein [Parvibaculum sp.]MBX3496527.1 DUF4345 family protein [Parvibaculum sp.]MCW5727083.1 DUF4345 family protein [Parvibaculum sp.]